MKRLSEKIKDGYLDLIFSATKHLETAWRTAYCLSYLNISDEIFRKCRVFMCLTYRRRVEVFISFRSTVIFSWNDLYILCVFTPHFKLYRLNSTSAMHCDNNTYFLFPVVSYKCIFLATHCDTSLQCVRYDML